VAVSRRNAKKIRQNPGHVLSDIPPSPRRKLLHTVKPRPVRVFGTGGPTRPPDRSNSIGVTSIPEEGLTEIAGMIFPWKPRHAAHEKKCPR